MKKIVLLMFSLVTLSIYAQVVKTPVMYSQAAVSGGGEMLNNPSFTSGDYWATGGGGTISGGNANLPSGGYVTQTDANMVSGIKNSTSYHLIVTTSTTGYIYIFDTSRSWDYLDGYQTLVNGINTFDFTSPSDIESIGAGLRIESLDDGLVITEISLTEN